MPEIGGKSLAGQLTAGLAGLKKELDALKTDAAGAVMEFQDELRNGREGVKRLRSESAEVRKAFGEILGNEVASKTDETKAEDKAATEEKPGVTNGT